MWYLCDKNRSKYTDLAGSSECWVGDYGKIAVVTSASRGAVKGIALALGQVGMMVYITGRSLNEKDSAYGGTIYDTASLITVAGGHGIPLTK